MTRRRAERRVTWQVRSGEQALETFLAGAIQPQLVQALLVERQRAFSAADLEAQVVLVAMLEPTAAERTACAVGKPQQRVD